MEISGNTETVGQIEKKISKRLLLDLPKELHQEVKIQAKLKGNSVSSELRNLIVKGLKYANS
jgi:plasmid stability protein